MYLHIKLLYEGLPTSLGILQMLTREPRGPGRFLELYAGKGVLSAAFSKKGWSSDQYDKTSGWDLLDPSIQNKILRDTAN